MAAKKTFETAMEELESIVSELENSDAELEKSISLFEKGVKLSAFCAEKLNSAKQKVNVLLSEGDEPKFGKMPHEND